MGHWGKALGAGVLLALVSAVSASAQDDYEGQARSYLEAGMERHAALGYQRERAIADLAAPLRLNSPRLWEINLRAGSNYRIYGACDNDCSDLDMEIYGNDGALVDRDVATDDVPYVQITPQRSGRHYVRLWVYACASEPCYAAARVVSGGTPSARQPLAESDGETGDAADDYIGVVQAELEDAGINHLAAGYVPFGEDVIVPVGLEGEGHRQALRLEAGYAYLFQGACDQDCSDVDMEALDAAGRQLAEDIAADDRPVVAVTPAADGDYAVRIWLAQCSVEPCFVGLRAYRRTLSAAPR
jgi:hypothetical protein